MGVSKQVFMQEGRICVSVRICIYSCLLTRVHVHILLQSVKLRTSYIQICKLLISNKLFALPNEHDNHNTRFTYNYKCIIATTIMTITNKAMA